MDERLKRLIANREKAAQAREQLLAKRKAITDVAEEEARDELSEEEDTEFRDLTSQIAEKDKSLGDYDERIRELSDEAEREQHLSAGAIALRKAQARAVVTSEARTYDRGNGRSYFLDLARVRMGEDPTSEAGDRLQRHAREVETDKEYRAPLNRTDGTGGYCTGSVINAANKGTVWTAGHCIHSGGGGTGNYFSNFIFVPDADNNSEPWGRWTWKYANTTVGWQNSGNLHYDVAAIAFNSQAAHGNLQDWTGSQGYKFNQGQAWTGVNTFGFPQDGYQRTDFSGNDLWYCFGNTSRVGTFDDLIQINCDMHHGASGGPWLQDLQLSRGWGYIIGAYSHRAFANNAPTDIVAKSANHGDGAINVFNDVSVR